MLGLTLNESYKRTKEYRGLLVKNYRIPKVNSQRLFIQKTKWKRQYNEDNYHGVLRIHVKDSLNLLLLMKGFIEGLKLNVEK